MKKNWILWGAVAFGAYLIYKKMKSTGSDKELAPPPVNSNFGKPPVSPKPILAKPTTLATENTISEQI